MVLSCAVDFFFRFLSFFISFFLSFFLFFFLHFRMKTPLPTPQRNIARKKGDEEFHRLENRVQLASYCCARQPTPSLSTNHLMHSPILRWPAISGFRSIKEGFCVPVGARKGRSGDEISRCGATSSCPFVLLSAAAADLRSHQHTYIYTAPARHSGQYS